MKKSLVLALVAVLVLSFASMAFAFTDTPDWAKAQIDKLAEMKIVNGVSATSFNAAGNVTRAEFAKMIVLSKGIALENPATATFKDVPATAWFFPYVEAAAKAKLIDGIGDGKFAPTALITREQVAKIVVLAAGKTADTTKALNFDDKASISDWAKGFVAVAADLKLMQGSNNKFAPKANATRAEGAVLVYNELVFEGKIVKALPANVISKDLLAGDGDVEIGGTLYTFETGALFKIAGKFVTDKTLFIKGTPVVVTSGDKDKVAILEGTPKFVEGKVEAKGANADGDTVTVAGTKLVFATAAKRNAVGTQYANVNLSVSYKFLQNSDGKVYAVLSSTTSKKSGLVTDVGYTKVGDDDQYYITLDGKAYNLKKAQAPDKNLGVLQYVYLDGAISTSDADRLAKWNALSTDYAATVELNADGQVTVIRAFNTEQTGTTVQTGATYYATFTDVDGNVKNLKNLVSIAANVYVGESASSAEVGTRTLLPGSNLILMATSTTTIKDDGATVKLADIKTGDYAVTTVNGEGVVTAVEVKDNVAKGQVSAFTEDSNDRLVDISVNGVKYVLTDTYSASYVNTGGNEVKVAKTYVALTLNSSGKVSGITKTNLLLNTAGDEVQTFTLIATPFEKGRPLPGTANQTDDTYAAANSLRVMDSLGNVIEFTVPATITKAGKTVKLAEITKAANSTIAVNAGTTVVSATYGSTFSGLTAIILNPTIK